MIQKEYISYSNSNTLRKWRSTSLLTFLKTIKTSRITSNLTQAYSKLYKLIIKVSFHWIAATQHGASCSSVDTWRSSQRASAHRPSDSCARPEPRREIALTSLQHAYAWTMVLTRNICDNYFSRQYLGISTDRQ